jgi:hypothetical protein
MYIYGFNISNAQKKKKVHNPKMQATRKKYEYGSCMIAKVRCQQKKTWSIFIIYFMHIIGTVFLFKSTSFCIAFLPNLVIEE